MKIGTLLKLMLFCVPMSAIGLLFMSAPFGSAARDARVLEAGVQATATITEKHVTRGSILMRTSTQYILDYEFRLPDGRLQTGRASNAPFWKETQFGDQIRVHYDAANPRNNFAHGQQFSTALAVGLAIMGLIAQIPMALVWTIFLQGRKKKPAD